MSAGGWGKILSMSVWDCMHGEGSRLAVGGRVACHDCCDLQLLLLILDCITSIQSEWGNIKTFRIYAVACSAPAYDNWERTG